MPQKYFLVLALLVANVLSGLQTRAQDPPKAPPKPNKKSAPNSGQNAESGGRVFAQNCSRCHATPDGFAPRISGTVVMHMRVRAALSRDDAQALLRFLNP